ncbi:MAG: transketolase [Candidatus Cloacimonadaceae bacterium]
MKTLTQTDFQTIETLANQARVNILHMTTLAGSGHPGGSMSAIDILLTLYSMINVDSKNPQLPDRERVVVSNGHISPGVYSTLGALNFFNMEDAIAEFRLAGSIFEGHVERFVPGVEWTTGNLGQGLSAGCGFALAGKINQLDYHTFVLMGDGEQQKGQITEARRFAIKYKLNKLIAIVDYNQLQISGPIHHVMPQNIIANWQSDGWQVLEIDGHKLEQIHDAIQQAAKLASPCMILAHTVMSKGVSFMENQAKYHGSALKEDQLKEALKELNGTNKLEQYKKLRAKKKTNSKTAPVQFAEFKPNFQLGNLDLYTTDTDNRSAWGNAIAKLAEVNQDNAMPIVVFDCDLHSSVKTGDFAKVNPERFIQAGIMEHNTAVTSGAMSTCGIQTWWADFGMFGIDEVYNQQRLNDINHANLKVVTTHVGIDVGEDGRTHQCIDYIGLARNLYNFKLLCPADPNQTDRIVRKVANEAGNYFITMGRSVIPILKTETGEVFYGADYVFTYGKADLIRNGDAIALIVTGTPVSKAMKAVDRLREEGIFVQLWYVSTPLEIDEEMLQQAVKTKNVITLEDHNINSGMGTIIADKLVELQLCCRLIKLGVKDYPVSGNSDDVYTWAGINTDAIVDTIKQTLQSNPQK